MFTGIVSSIGEVRKLIFDRDLYIEFSTKFPASQLKIGASISCSGVCLTVTQTGTNWFSVEVSEETLSKTTIRYWSKGTKVNLELALKMGDELGGHLVSGHVDGISKTTEVTAVGDSSVLTFKVPESLKKLIAKKGAITIDGVSLTVNTVVKDTFSVNIVRHTRENTILGNLEKNDFVNIEIDLIARYLARLIEKG